MVVGYGESLIHAFRRDAAGVFDKRRSGSCGSVPALKPEVELEPIQAMPPPMRETTPSRFVPRSRKVRILATLGPASNTRDMVLKLAEAGADAFRINMSHGTHADHLKLIGIVRSL